MVRSILTSFKKIQVLVENQRVITAFAGLKGMQSKNQSEIKVSGPKSVLQVPFYLLVCVVAQSLADLLLAGGRMDPPQVSLHLP